MLDLVTVKGPETKTKTEEALLPNSHLLSDDVLVDI